jgi:signal transduction histidine kinase
MASQQRNSRSSQELRAPAGRTPVPRSPDGALERLAALCELALAATFDLRVHEVVHRALMQLHELRPALRPMYGTIDAAGRFTVVRAIDAEGIPEVEGLTCDLTAAPEYLTALRSLALQVVDDVQADERLAPLRAELEGGGTRAFLAAPLRHGEDLVGLLSIDSPQSAAWTESDRALVSETAATLAVLIQDARLKEARREEARRLRAELDDLRRVLGAFPGRVWLLGSDGGVRDDLDRCRARPAADGAPIGPALCERLAAEVPAALSTGTASFECPGPAGAHGPGVLRVELVALPDGDEVAAFARDVSASAAERARLLRENGELLQASKEFERFAAASSHDLQEPLRMVSSYLQLLERRYGGAFDARAREYLGFAVEGAKRMQTLVQDLLAYARLERPGRRARSVACDEALDRALAALQARIVSSGAVVTREPLPVVWGDEEQLEQLLLQLLDNALKFRGAEPPRIRVSAEPSEGEWRFSVADNGPGIDAAFGERIFAPFQRLHGRAEGAGSGIGLALARRVVERHGGRIWVESAPGRGATFFFTLPAGTAPRSRGARSRAPKP